MIWRIWFENDPKLVTVLRRWISNFIFGNFLVIFEFTNTCKLLGDRVSGYSVGRDSYKMEWKSISKCLDTMIQLAWYSSVCGNCFFRTLRRQRFAFLRTAGQNPGKPFLILAEHRQLDKQITNLRLAPSSPTVIADSHRISWSESHRKFAYLENILNAHTFL